MYVMRLLFVILALAASMAQGGVDHASDAKISVIRGDRVKLAVRGDGLDEIQWFVRGKRICTGLTCEVATGEWVAGEYLVDAVVSIDQAYDVVHFAISVETALLLREPQTLKPEMVMTSQSRVTRVNRASPWIAAIQGRVARAERRAKAIVEATVPSPSPLQSHQMFRVPIGSQAVVSLSRSDEELLVVGPTELGLYGQQVRLESGRGLWRRLPSFEGMDRSGYQGNSKIFLRPNAYLYADAPGDTYIQAGYQEGQPAVEIFAGSSRVQLFCGEESPVAVETGQRVFVVYSQTDATCKIVSTRPVNRRQDLQTGLTSLVGHWFAEPANEATKFWVKAFHDLAIQRPNEEFVPIIKQAFEDKQWGAVLDLFSLSFGKEMSDPNLLMMRGRARFEMGLLDGAEIDFMKSLEIREKDALAAVQMGLLRLVQNRPADALDWFEKALRWNDPQAVETERLAGKAALLAKKNRKAAMHYQSAFLLEPDDAKALSDQSLYEQAQQLRKLRGAAQVSTEVMSHVLPVNPVKYGDLPNLAATNRALVFGMNGFWQKSLEQSKSLEVVLRGDHDFSAPWIAELSPGSRSDHRLSLESASVVLDTSRIIGGLSAGTRLRGGERQVDEFAGKVGFSSGGALRWDIGLSALRALDPAPGGSDIVDARLNRLVGFTDHSHFDSGLFAKVVSDRGFDEWSLGLSLQNLDFRTGEMDEYDGREVAVTGSMGHQWSRRWRTVADATVIQRSYKVRGSDQITQFDARLKAITAPLWDIELRIGYFARQATDESVQMNGHHYGLALGVQL